MAVAADVDEPGRVLVSGDCSPTSPAPARPRSRCPRRAPGRGPLRPLPVHPADPAGRRHPTLPDMPGPPARSSGATFASAVSQVATAAGRDDTLPILTGIRVEIAGARITLAPPTATGSPSGSAVEPGAPGPRLTPSSRRARSPRRPSRSPQCDDVSSRCPRRSGRRADGLRGRGVAPRAGCSTASSPSTARCSRASRRRSRGRDRRPGRRREARGPRGRAQHPGAAAFEGGEVSSRGRGRRGAGDGGRGVPGRGRPDRDRLQPAVPPRRSRRPRRRDDELSFTTSTRPAVLTGRQRRGRAGLPLPPHAGAALGLTPDPARSRPAPCTSPRSR